MKFAFLSTKKKRIKKKKKTRKRHTLRRRSCDHRSRGWSDLVTSQGTPGATRSWKTPGRILKATP